MQPGGGPGAKEMIGEEQRNHGDGRESKQRALFPVSQPGSLTESEHACGGPTPHHPITPTPTTRTQPTPTETPPPVTATTAAFSSYESWREAENSRLIGRRHRPSLPTDCCTVSVPVTMSC
ncbi:hypothetical protein AAFF_G00221010 [Aldrovandia affinis]|uniref:Uncharacterized protein n=1 Tax=Aldrovandia affinis TaxID=143900 RepID=A0AAD7RFM3_9TELE|nr:hypothetical protein AAFF_G00221010 [Aldrovandia affinis]